MEILFEVVFQFLLEIVLQFVFEWLTQLGWRSVADVFNRRPHPVFSTIGAAIMGAVAGGISLLIVSDAVIDDPNLRIVNLAVTPIVVGLLMVAIGRLRARKGEEIQALDRFHLAALFAFMMGMVRYFGAG